MRWTFGGVIWGESGRSGGSFGVRADIHDGHLREGGRSGGSFGMGADVQGDHL